ncbi:Flagellar biosynthetic protein flhB [Caenispirillum salinarum AK4]|uniref:Flagellar biosynthetic protein flhB n=1 Tax=Caenispirillum salinarum AK4 TaxID=1238182 RepID=K9H7X1_9PROT|nr:EscU/YscU/HrcU family type III secretion system export apparatus switch protein [Caenispirillum salinarum]EKV26683.1 Flagellar biosynthetic protein flhB [Caenispirillum salinarum AK4]
MAEDHHAPGARRRPQRAQAVALDWNPETDAVPKVVASGSGSVAEQILNLAFANGVRVREDADLVQILGALDVDMEIPPEAYAAVAEILVYVYRANGQELPLPPDSFPDAETRS